MEIGYKVLKQAFKLVHKIQCTHLIKCLDVQPVDLYLGCNLILLEGLQVTILPMDWSQLLHALQVKNNQKLMMFKR